MDDVAVLKDKVKTLETLIFALVLSDRYLFSRNIQMADGRNIQLATGTGTKIGTATTQKVGFFNATPVAQQANTTDLKNVLVNLGFLVDGGATPLNLDAGALTAGSITLTGNIVNNEVAGMKIGGSGNKIGFYDTTPTALQTGVAVSAAGIHAALVNLGLITA